MKEKILDDTFIHYWINDQSTSDICLFFSHGVTADHRCFKRQEEFFKKKYKIINWDIPMHGQSKKENFVSYKSCASLMKQILDKEKINKVVLIGLSLGGYPSQMFAYLYPESTMGLVAIDTTPFGLKYYSKYDISLLKQVGWSTKCFPTNLLKKSMAKSISKTKYAYDLMLEMVNESSKDTIARQMEIAYSEFILENQDIKLDRDIPVLLLLGDSDKTGKIKHYCMAWQKETNYPLHIIKNASHFSNSDNSESVNGEIENFVKKISQV